MTPTAPRKAKLITIDQFAEDTGLTPKGVRNKIARRELEFVRIGRTIRLRADLIDELIKRGTVPARKAAGAR